MNKVLLKKIEELTLHLIELKKEVEQLNKELGKEIWLSPQVFPHIQII